MYVYYFNAISAIIYRLFFLGNKNDRRFLFIVCLQMFIILSIRADTFGADARAYIGIYASVSRLSLLDIIENFRFFRNFPLPPAVESGYVFINWICAKSGLSYHAFIVILSFVDCYCMYMFLREFSYSPLLGTLMFQTLTWSWFFILRRAMAMNFVFLAFIALKRKKHLATMLLLIVAVTMHRIALAFVFYPLLARIKITKRLFRIVFIGIVAAAVVSAIGIDLLYSIFDALGKGRYIKTVSDVSGLRITGIILVIITFYGVYISVDFRQFQTSENSVLGAMFFVAMLFLIIYYATHGVEGVLRWVVLLIFILVVNIIVKYEDRTTRFILWSAAFIFILFWTYRWISDIPLNRNLRGLTHFMTVWD